MPKKKGRKKKPPKIINPNMRKLLDQADKAEYGTRKKRGRKKR